MSMRSAPSSSGYDDAGPSMPRIPPSSPAHECSTEKQSWSSASEKGEDVVQSDAEDAASFTGDVELRRHPRYLLVSGRCPWKKT